MRVVYAAIVISIAVVIAAWIAGSSFEYKSKADETITVTGLAEKDFTSDLIVWNGSYSRKSMDLKTAYSQLKDDETAIRNYLVSKGISNNEIITSAVNINKEFNTKTSENGGQISQEFAGYNLTQTITVQSADVDKIDQISRQSTELIENGIEFTSQPPFFYNTKLSEVKMDLLARASADAKQRAETIAKNAGSKLGKLKKATMGVFQITGKNSNEDYSYGGAFNTSNKLKTGSITIKMEFAAD
jgi:hypothetical protein